MKITSANIAINVVQVFSIIFLINKCFSIICTEAFIILVKKELELKFYEEFHTVYVLEL